MNEQEQKTEQQVIWTADNIGVLDLFTRPLMELFKESIYNQR